MNKKLCMILIFIVILFIFNTCFAASLISSAAELKNYNNNILINFENMSNYLNNVSQSNINLDSSNIMKQCFNLFSIVIYSVLGVIIFNVMTKILVTILDKMMKKIRFIGKKNNIDKIMKSIRKDAFYRA